MPRGGSADDKEEAEEVDEVTVVVVAGASVGAAASGAAFNGNADGASTQALGFKDGASVPLSVSVDVCGGGGECRSGCCALASSDISDTPPGLPAATELDFNTLKASSCFVPDGERH